MLGTQVQSASLRASANASLSWRYHAPIKIDVYIRPDGGCADEGNDCQELAHKCSSTNAAAITAEVGRTPIALVKRALTLSTFGGVLAGYMSVINAALGCAYGISL